FFLHSSFFTLLSSLLWGDLPALLLYLLTTIVIVAIWHRYVQPVSRAATIVLVLLPLCFTGRALLTGRVYAPIDLPFQSEPLKDYAHDYGTEHGHNGTVSDLYSQIIPWRYAVRVAISHGQWPLWNPFLLCGDILAANAQSAPYDPFNLLTLLIPFATSLTFTASITFFLAAFFTFALARALGCSEEASLVAAAGFAFSGELAFFVGWPLSRAWAYLPLVMLGARLVARETNLRAAVVLTTGFVLTILAGHPETILHVVAIGACYGSAEAVLARRRLAKATLVAFASGIIALALTTIFLLPFLEASGHTVETKMRLDVYAKARFKSDPGLIARRAGLTFLPFFGGQPWHDNVTALWDPQSARVGSVILALAAAALVVARRRRATWGFFAMAVLSLLGTFDAPPVAHVLHWLPGFNIALNSRLAYAAALALSILAALAVDALPRNRRGAAATVLAVAASLALATKLVWTSQVGADLGASFIGGLAFAELAPLVVLALLLVLRTPARGVVMAILALVLLQRSFEDGGIYPTIPASSFYPGIPIVAAMKPSAEPYRMTGRYYAFIPDTAALYELEDARGYEAMTFERLAQTYPLWSQAQPVSFNLVTDLTRPFLSALNVRYALSSDDTEPPDGWTLAGHDRHSRLFENTRVLPRAFVPLHVRYRPSSTAVLDEMAGAKDFAETAWIETPELPPSETANGPGKLAIQRNGAGFLIDATMEGDGWIVLSESAWPGWRVYVDGHRLSTHFANHAFLGVFVPKGKHSVRFNYLPASFTRGRAITFATIFLLGVAELVRRKRGRQTGPEPRASS
ncbi:MAG: YfhO family protein, partial [Acidobacteriota bacterium]